MRAFGGCEPITDEIPTGSTVGMPAIGLAVPNSYQIIVPDVEPGTYRMFEIAINPASEVFRVSEVPGFVIVEVS